MSPSPVRWSMVSPSSSAAARSHPAAYAVLKGVRLLHIITSLSETNALGRTDERTVSRLPALFYALRALRQACALGMDLSLVVIAGWGAEAKRDDFAKMFHNQCSRPLRLGIWEHAVPQKQTADGGTRLVPRALANQHRFVVAREMEEHDLFSCWEDDMRVTADLLLHFVRTSAEIESAATKAQGAELELAALRQPPLAPNATHLPAQSAGVDYVPWRTPLERRHWLRVLPALLRVEASRFGARMPRTPPDARLKPTASVESGAAAKALSAAFSTFTAFAAGSGAVAAAAAAAMPLPPPPDLRSEQMLSQVLSRACCDEPSPLGEPVHAPAHEPRLANATAGELLAWEWSDQSMGVRLMPPFGWVGVLPSASAGWLGSFSAEAPDAPPLSALQGGWMLTRAQLERARALCPGGFLPPAGADATGAPWLPRYSVDFWSGAQLFSWKHCGFARIALLSTPRDVASQLVMHATANKQLQVPHKVHRVVHTLESLWRLVQLANASAAQPHAPSDAADAQLPREQRTEGCATEHCRREQAGSEQPWKRRGRRALAV